MIEVDFCGKKLSSPILTASGTSNYGREISDFGDLSILGGVVGKTITPEPRQGNPMPRIAETSSGIINAIGLENVGLERFLKEIVPSFIELPCLSVVNIAGFSIEQYGQMAAAVTGKGFDLIEINGSCPNVEHGGRVFCDDPQTTKQVVEAVKAQCQEPIMMKLSPNVSDIVSVAQAAVEGGSDSLSLINTVVGTTVDWRSRKKGTAFGSGGLSGPAVKPIALHMVDQVCGAVDVPVCAIGGASNVDDVCEFLALGARAVQIGTALFRDPQIAFKIVQELPQVIKEAGYSSVNDLIGCAR